MATSALVFDDSYALWQLTASGAMPDGSYTLWHLPPSTSTTVAPSRLSKGITALTQHLHFAPRLSTRRARVHPAHANLAFSPNVSALDSHDLRKGCKGFIGHSRSSHTIRAKGSSSQARICTPPHVCALDTHDLRRGSRFASPVPGESCPSKNQAKSQHQNNSPQARSQHQSNSPKQGRK